MTARAAALALLDTLQGGWSPEVLAVFRAGLVEGAATEQRVLSLHQPFGHPGDPGVMVCRTCGETKWPCRTIRALGGAESESERPPVEPPAATGSDAAMAALSGSAHQNGGLRGGLTAAQAVANAKANVPKLQAAFPSVADFLAATRHTGDPHSNQVGR